MAQLPSGARSIGIGLLGYGNVGSAVGQLLSAEHDHILERTGLSLSIVAVGVRDLTKARETPLHASVFTTDLHEVVGNPQVDVVVELLGGMEPARGLITAALRAGKPVVTGNKELLSVAGAELSAVAQLHKTALFYEAAVGGGIPIMRSLQDSLAAEPISRIMGIVNGTTNFILTAMTDDNADYSDALAMAQAKGFAEADPTADVEAFDAAAKAMIIASVAFGAAVQPQDVYREGISAIRAEDIEAAGRLGFVVKLLAIIEKSPDGRVGVRVHPTMVGFEHPLASVRMAFNAVFVQGETVGDLMFYGRGAGGEPTASAVLGDLVAAGRYSHNPLAPTIPTAAVGPWPLSEQSSAFYLALEVADRPGVLAEVAGVFAEHDISIRSMEQLGFGSEAKLVFITHRALEQKMAHCREALAHLDAVGQVGNVMRVLES